MKHRVLVLAVLLSLAGCAKKLGVKGASCNASSDCGGELQCLQSMCETMASDAPPGPGPSGPAGPPSQVSPQEDNAELRAQIDESRREIEKLREELLALKAGEGTLTPVECNAFADKVVELTVQGQEGAAAEMARGMIAAMKPEMTAECLSKGRKSEVDCALRARTLAELERCDESRPRPPSSVRPSERDCVAFADKVVELTVKGQQGAAAEMARGMIEAMKPEMIKDCRERGRSSEIACALRASSLEDLELCDNSKR